MRPDPLDAAGDRGTPEAQRECLVDLLDDAIRRVAWLPKESPYLEMLAELRGRRASAQRGDAPASMGPISLYTEMTDEARGEYILNWVRPGITVEQQIREVLPLVAGELGNDYGKESHIRAARYVHDVRFLLAEIDCLRGKLTEARPNGE